MAFQRIDLPAFSSGERHKAVGRWEGEAGRDVEETILDLIREGAGEDFLQAQFERGELGFLRDQWDLAGFKLFSESIEFPDGDSFENIDFRYAEIYHSTLVNACFPQTHFSFTRLYNTTFRSCIFVLAHFYGARIEKCRFIECDFVDPNGFSNCEFSGTIFEDCFFDDKKFVDCRFDQSVRFRNTTTKSPYILLANPRRFSSTLENQKISSIYQGMKEAYLAGEIHKEVRRFHFLQNRAYTQYNLTSPERISSFLWECVSGYGLRPLRVLVCLAILLAVGGSWFTYALGNFEAGFLLAAGALFTFGAKNELLDKISTFYTVLYILLAFAGISFTALFITVMANVHLKDR